jgi:hypothetical protein
VCRVEQHKVSLIMVSVNVEVSLRHARRSDCCGAQFYGVHTLLLRVH